MKTKYLGIFPAVGFRLLFSALPLYASLGGNLATIETDRRGLQGEEQVRARMHVQKRTGYSVHEITVDGTQVQEYALPTGTVFAVSWRGTTEPNLSLLLGKYFGAYEKELVAPESMRSRGPRVLRSKNMVVERSGHMRDLRGRAYLTDLVPTAFNLKEFR